MNKRNDKTTFLRRGGLFLRECKIVRVRINLFTWCCEWSKQEDLRVVKALRARSTEENSEYKRP